MQDKMSPLQFRKVQAQDLYNSISDARKSTLSSLIFFVIIFIVFRHHILGLEMVPSTKCLF